MLWELLLLLIAHLVDRPLVERVGKSEVAVELPVEGRLPVGLGYACRFDDLDAVLAEVNADDRAVWQVELALHHDLWLGYGAGAGRR